MISRGFIAWSVSQSSSALSIVSGTLFSTRISQCSTSFRTASLPSGCIISQAIDRLFRACELKAAVRFHGSEPGSLLGNPIGAPLPTSSFICF